LGSFICVAAGNQVLIFPESGYSQSPIGKRTDGISTTARPQKKCK
jgi:hypothetical protein